jgi:hypothetical protein
MPKKTILIWIYAGSFLVEGRRSILPESLRPVCPGKQDAETVGTGGDSLLHAAGSGD